MRSLATVLCTSGLKVEARIAQAAGFSVVVGAGDRDRTAALVAAAAAKTDCLVSFGIAGGLSPELQSGTVVVSGEVVAEGCHWAIEPAIRRQLSQFARSIGAVEGRVLGARSILALQTEKQSAWTATRALDHEIGQLRVRETPQPVGFPLHPPPRLVAVQHRRVQGLVLNLLVPGEQNLFAADTTFAPDRQG